MQKPATTPTAPKITRWITPIIAATIFLLASWWVWMVFVRPVVASNRAQEVARPIEDGLVKAGAEKKHVSGNNGLAIGNSTPWYKADYDLPGDKEKAISLVSQVAASAGLPLTHASPENKGDRLGRFSHSAEQLDRWYFNESKASPYSELRQGNITFLVQVAGDGAYESGPVPTGMTRIQIEVVLPYQKS